MSTTIKCPGWEHLPARPANIATRKRARWLQSIDEIIENANSVDFPSYVDEWVDDAGLTDEQWDELGLPKYPSQRPSVRSPEYPAFADAINKYYDSLSRIKMELFGTSDTFRYMLDYKREDECYEDVLMSLKEHGFVRPVTALPDPGAKYGFKYGDGHHRLAAAIDLGYTHVPIMLARDLIAADSGEWYYGRPIPKRHVAVGW